MANKVFMENMSALDEELHFLILRYLESGPCKEAAKVLKEEVKKFQLLPKRIDWEGRNYPKSYSELVHTHPHIASDHLKRICCRIPSLLDEKYPPTVRGVQSLLGAGSLSLLRSDNTQGVTLRPTGYLLTKYDGLSPIPNCLLNKPNILRNTQSAQITGRSRTAHTQPVEIYKNYKLHRRFLGHLSAVYCVLYDRSGNFIFTGSDDKLVKVWSALTGRLLATLRGHDGEIVDLAVNYENTMLASGSCDKLVRIWCLQSTVCLAVLHGHSATITSLRFCPLASGDIRYLVSTGEDATVCFWQYSKSEKSFESRPSKFIERTRAGAKMLCSSFSPGGMFLATGNSDSVIRIYSNHHIRDPRKIGELEAHTDMVDSIQYSNLSDRFISGSKDGTARIWRQKGKSWLNLILYMKSKDGDSSQSLKVNMVAWTVDDEAVLTAVSDFSVRVWSSTTGLLLNTLLGHEDDVFVIECAVFSKNLVVTAGHDGRIKLWDMTSGRTLLDCYNMIDGQGFGAAYDCKWSPQDHSFSVTDSHGHLMRFGLGDNDRLTEDKIPTELYFHTDYRGLIRDANDHVLDEPTQRAVHLLPPPFLVNVDAIPYPPKFQRLVPGREHLPEQYLKALFIDLPNGDREVIDQEVPASLQNPTPVSNTQTISNNTQLTATSSDQSSATTTTTSQSMNTPVSSAGTSQCADTSRPPTSRSQTSRPTSSQSDAAVTSSHSISDTTSLLYSIAQRNPAVDSATPAAAAASSTQQNGTVHTVTDAAAPNPQIPARCLRSVINALREDIIERMEGIRREMADREFDGFIAESKSGSHHHHSGASDEDSAAGYLPVYMRTRRNRPYVTRTARRREENQANVQRVRNRLTERALYDTDVETDEEVADSAPDDQSADESTDDSSSDDNIPTSSRASHQRRVKDSMQSDGGSCNGSTSSDGGGSDKESSSDYSDWEMDNKTILQPPSRRSGRKINPPRTLSPSIESTSGTPTKQKQVKQQRKISATRSSRARRRAKKMAAQFNSSADDASSEMLVPGLDWLSWLQMDAPHRDPYFPQMGDELIYFFQGHQLYVEEVAKKQLYPPIRSLPWNKEDLNLNDQELVKVVGIKFEIKPPNAVRLCCLRVGKIRANGKLTDTNFTIKYHDMNGVIDFLVPRQFYDISQRRNWQVSDRFRSVIDDKWWSGTVSAHRPYDPIYTDSLFLCLKVQWDDEDESGDTLSPWDLEPLADDTDDNIALKGSDMTEEENLLILYEPSISDWPECGREQECNRINNCLEQLMSHSVSEWFNAPVDLNQVENYVLEIAYPMDLSLIKSRLESRFYRRLAAIQFDVRHLESNAEQFNQSGSQIVRNARIVTEVCLTIISDTTCVDVSAIFSKLDLDDEYFAIDEQPEENNKGKKKQTPGADSSTTTNGRESFDWKSELMSMIDELFAHDDSEPFRAPVDVLHYQDYNEVISTPVDLSFIRENLECDEYSTMNEVFRDIRLMIANSRKYNTNKRSRIYLMTIRLSALVEERLQNLTRRYKKFISNNRAPPSSSSRKSQSTKKSRSKDVPLDPLITMMSRNSTRSTRFKESYREVDCNPGPSTSSSIRNSRSNNRETFSQESASSSHYSTRSTTGRNRPKRFADDMLVDAPGSFVQVSRKARKLHISDDESEAEHASPSPAKRGRHSNLINKREPRETTTRNVTTRRQQRSLSDYEKDTDEEENGEDEEEEETDVEMDEQTDEEEADDEIAANAALIDHSDSETETPVVRKRGQTKNKTSNRESKVKTSSRARNGHSSYSISGLRQRRGVVRYAEESDSPELASESSEDEIQVSSRGRVIKNKWRYG